MAPDKEPVSLADMARIQALDAQIDQFQRAGAALPPGQDEALDQPFLQDVHDFYHPQAEAIQQTLGRVWARLEPREASAAQPERRARAASQPDRQPRPLHLLQPAGRASRAERHWFSRLSTLVAAVMLLALVGGLVAGLVLGHRASSGSKPAGTTHPMNIYISADDGIYKVDASTGAIRWHFKTQSVVTNGPPIVANGVVYFITWFEGLYAVNASDGSLLWQVKLHLGLYPQLAVANGLVYVDGINSGYNMFLQAFDARTGAVRWQQETFGPSPVTFADGVLYVIDASPTADDRWWLDARRASDGTLLWQVPVAQQNEGLTAPVVVDGRVYLISNLYPNPDGTGGPFVFAYAFSTKDGTLLWRSEQLDGITAADMPTVAGGFLYVGTSGYVYALRVSDGSQFWLYATDGPVSSSPQIVDSVVYIGVVGTLAHPEDTILALNASDAAVRWKTPIMAHTNGEQLDFSEQPALANGVFYIVGKGTLYALKTGDGSIWWHTTLTSRAEGNATNITIAP